MSVSSLRPGVIVRIPVKFPASVTADLPIVITKTGANYHFSIDSDELSSIIGNILDASISAWEDNLPTSPVGIAIGDWWSNDGTPTRVKR